MGKIFNTNTFSGKNIIVTGASSGIGRGTAIFLSELGARIILIARNKEKLEETISQLHNGDHKIYPFDLKETEKIEGLVKDVVKENGKVDGFVHCAGIATMRPLSLTKTNFLHDMMLINFYSYVELIRCISKKGNCSEGASFVGMSSVASIDGIKSKVAYCSSKAAMDSATRCLAKELASKNIRVNNVVAGFIKTEMFDDYLETAGNEAVENNIYANQYLGMGEIKDATNAIAFLLSDASKFITGTGFVVDGGYLS